MSDGVNFTPYQVGGNDGGGFGGMGGIGGVLIGALLGRGLLGGEGRRVDGGGECLTPAQFIAGLNNVSDQVSTTAILGKLGTLEGAVPLAEAQTQLAIAVSQNAIQGQAVTNATAQALANCGILSAINADGDRTRSLITALEVSTLNRELGVAQSALLEERFSRRSRESEINITNTNTATAQATQSQFQAQQQFQIMATLAAQVGNLANDIQVIRQGQTIFNSGTMAASGTQAAANTAVN